MTQHRERELNLNVRIHPEERAKLHALAADRDISVSMLIRHTMRELYTARFGNTAPAVTEAPRAKRKRAA